MTSNRPDALIVGRIGKPHGLKGELSVESRTDEPARRFVDGAVLLTESDRPGPPLHERLTVASTRSHQGRLLIHFVEITDRTGAEEARGLRLVVALDRAEKPEDPEEFYDHQLVGLKVVTTEGAPVGELLEVVHGSAQDLLVVKTHDREVLVPFVKDLVPFVDLATGQIHVVDRPGLLSEADQ